MPINNYLKEIKSIYSPSANEHTYRTPLENLINSYKGNKKIRQEITTDKDFPDFTILDENEKLVGFIECKDIDSDLKAIIEGKKKSYKREHEQLLKYLTISPIVIFTDYIEFYLLKEEESKLIEIKHIVLLDSIDSKNKTISKDKEIEFEIFIKEFLESKPEPIKRQDYFISLLARRTKILRDGIHLDILNNNSYFKKEIKGLFNNTIFKDLNDKDFVDAFSQIITFGLLFYRLSKKQDVSINTFSEMPEYIPIFKEFLHIFNIKNTSKIIEYSIESIINAVNAYDKEMFYKELSYKEEHDNEDPFIYMYESFLKEFDPNTRNARGVFYTPIEVVRYLIKSTDEILKNRLNLENGLRNKDVHILDFATGTGTFLLGTIEHIYNELMASNNQGLWKDNVSSFILKQLYGFEFLIVPYVLAHFRIHEFLEDCDYKYKSDDRLQLYLTNTLDNALSGAVAMFPKMNEEADRAFKVKNEEPILVVMGNPPYNSKSDATNSKEWILGLLQDYKKNLNEKKINLDDDYIKFIRFAHWKMEKTEKGIISIIVNNSFINGITHRQMRKSLMNVFDEIYIFDLHGNMNKSEKCHDGSQDFNIFNIKDVGVCMAVFVKTGIKNNKNAGVYFQEIFGTQKYKKEFLIDKSVFVDKENNKWTKIEDDKKWHWFTPVKSNAKYLEEFWGLAEIFELINSGVKTERDKITIHKNKEDLKQVIKDFNTLDENEIKNKYNTYDSRDWRILKAKSDIEKNYKKYGFDLITSIHYRPFDFRYTYYTGTTRGFIGTPGKKMAVNFINKKNIGLVFVKQMAEEKEYDQVFLTSSIVDIRITLSNRGTAYIAPLYIYDENTTDDLAFDEGVRDNFTKSFSEFLKSYHTSEPYKILSYIYAVLYSPTYRAKYKEDLAYDYPRIPFTDDQATFDAMSYLGDKLINLHLLKTHSKTNHGYPVEGDNSVYKPHQNDNKLYINDCQYFENVSEEVFNYSIGGYKVLDKYIKARETLSVDDIVHIQKIISIIVETIIIQNDIDTQVLLCTQSDRV